MYLLNSLSLGCYIGALTGEPEHVVEHTRGVSFPPPSFALPLSSFTDGKARDTWVNVPWLAGRVQRCTVLGHLEASYPEKQVI